MKNKTIRNVGIGMAIVGGIITVIQKNYTSTTTFIAIAIIFQLLYKKKENG